jgi:hypothetical protein
MITADKRKAVFLLHQEGMRIREISRGLKLRRNTVRRIIAQAGQMPEATHPPAHVIDPDLLCVIDNTNLARLRGLGSNAVMVPEMETFAKSYGFTFLCHAPKHSDRKAARHDQEPGSAALQSSLPCPSPFAVRQPVKPAAGFHQNPQTNP